MNNYNINIDGMSCQHCVMNVKNAIDSLEGIQSSEVAVGKAAVLYDESKTSQEAISNAVVTAGFKVLN